LSTIYGFARQSGGDAHIRSVARRGTEVTIMLPASSDPTASEAELTMVDPQGAGEHVLIVEDTPSVRMFVAEVLVDAGYRCTQVGDIEGALERLQNDRIHRPAADRCRSAAHERP
jgi:PleD family two-component response regulator